MDLLAAMMQTLKIYMTGDQKEKPITKKLIDFMMKEMIKDSIS